MPGECHLYSVTAILQRGSFLYGAYRTSLMENRSSSEVLLTRFLNFFREIGDIGVLPASELGADSFFQMARVALYSGGTCGSIAGPIGLLGPLVAAIVRNG